MPVITITPMIKPNAWENLFSTIKPHLFIPRNFLGNLLPGRAVRYRLCIPATPSRQVFPQHALTAGFTPEVTTVLQSARSSRALNLPSGAGPGAGAGSGSGSGAGDRHRVRGRGQVQGQGQGPGAGTASGARGRLRVRGQGQAQGQSQGQAQGPAFPMARRPRAGSGIPPPSARRKAREEPRAVPRPSGWGAPRCPPHAAPSTLRP